MAREDGAMRGRGRHHDRVSRIHLDVTGWKEMDASGKKLKISSCVFAQLRKQESLLQVEGLQATKDTTPLPDIESFSLNYGQVF